MKRAIIFLLLVFSNILYSQVSVAANHTSAFLPQGLSLLLLNGNGNSAIYNDVTNISAINPAALENYNNFTFGFSYQYETQMDESWIADIGSKRINNFVPQSAGIVYPYNDLRITISMNQKYNRSLLFGPIKITTIENPDGTSEVFEVENETFIYNYSFSTSYTVDNFLNNSRLSFGFRIGFYKLTDYQEFYKSSIDASAYSRDISFGVLYTTPKLNNSSLKLGLFYQSKLEFNEEVEVFHDEVRIDDNSPFPTAIFPTEMRLVANFPSSIRFDFDFIANNKLRFLGSVSNSYWSDIEDNFKNQIEITGSVSLPFNESLTPSLGFAYSEKGYVEDYFELNKKLDVIFITAGTVLKFNNLSVNLALADSHLFSGDFRKTTIGKLGLGYSL